MGNLRKLQSIKEFRRQRIAALLDDHGKVGLSTLTDISADYLWQMGKGTGKSARGVSDANAAKIESRLGKPAGWLDGPATDQEHQSHLLQLDPLMLSQTYKVLLSLDREADHPFSLGNLDDAAHFVQVYEMRAAMPLRPTDEEWIEFGRKLTTLTPTGGDDGRGGAAMPAEGIGQIKVARKVQRKD